MTRHLADMDIDRRLWRRDVASMVENVYDCVRFQSVGAGPLEDIPLVMIDYNVSDHWSEDEPVWVKSLASSLERRHGVSTVLPLTVVLEEIINWVHLASGEDAWSSRANRESLRQDLEEAVSTLGAAVRLEIDVPLAQFQSAFTRLSNSKSAVLKQAAGTRTGAAWADVVMTAQVLLSSLDSDTAVGATWDDLVGTAKNRALERREYRPIAELLFDQLRRRGLSAEWTFRHVVSMVAFGLSPRGMPIGKKDVPLDERVAGARLIACTPAKLEPIVVWLGYQGRPFPQFSAGRVTFLDAHWAVPNARPGGRAFEHKAELWELVKHGHVFQIATRIDEKSDVDFLVRVDLDETTAAGAVKRATEIVNTILNVSIHNAGGIRPHLAQHGVLRRGRLGSSSFMVSRREARFPNDHYGAEITADAIEEYGPRIAEALAREELPRFLAAALEVQTIADHPFSREVALRKPSEADISSVVPLTDRVVQHIAAHACLKPDATFTLLGRRWPHARWLTDVQRAVHMCLLGGGQRDELLADLRGEWYNSNRPWILFVADRVDDLLLLCRIESERAWVERMLRSVRDSASYAALVDDYTAEGRVLHARRGRVRNALVHGNPASFAAVESVREYAEFLSGSALQLSLESFVTSTDPATALFEGTEESEAMRSGQDAASYWRERTATEG